MSRRNYSLHLRTSDGRAWCRLLSSIACTLPTTDNEFAITCGACLKKLQKLEDRVMEDLGKRLGDAEVVG